MLPQFARLKRGLVERRRQDTGHGTDALDQLRRVGRLEERHHRARAEVIERFALRRHLVEDQVVAKIVEETFLEIEIRILVLAEQADGELDHVGHVRRHLEQQFLQVVPRGTHVNAPACERAHAGRDERRRRGVRAPGFQQAEQPPALGLWQANKDIRVRPVRPLAVGDGKCAQAVEAQRTKHLTKVDAQFRPVRRIVEQLRNHLSKIGPQVKVGVLQQRAVVRRERRVASQCPASSSAQPRQDTLDLSHCRADNQLGIDATEIHLSLAFRVAHRGEIDPANFRLSDFAIRLLPVALHLRQSSAKGKTFPPGIEQQQQRRFLTGCQSGYHGQGDRAAGHLLERIEVDRQFLLDLGQHVRLEAVGQFFAERFELGAVPKLPRCAGLEMLLRGGVVRRGHHQHGFSRQQCLQRRGGLGSFCR